MIAACKKFVFDCLSDNTGAWCGARVGIMGGFVLLLQKYAAGGCSTGEFTVGCATLAVAYAGKDWSERR